MKYNKVELLAPAGNIQGFYAAISAGADAVYLGGSKFGARAFADNFTEEELIHCIRYAHILGRKVYLTVNTLVKEKEFAQLFEYLLPLYENGLDGVIIQDIGILTYIREHFPQMELHVSTQMTLTGKYGANMLKELGACRIVPARELSLEEMKEIKSYTGLEIETFVHGAMCYCYSGQCLFSSILGGRSGNRGRCAQPCRLPYDAIVNDNITKDCYPLSLKDMCTIEHIPQLIEAGINSFKIEGRMKKPEYSAGVTSIYRKYIDRYYQNPNDKLVIEKSDLDKLANLYIRSEQQDGYYFKHNGREMVTLKNPAYSGNDEAFLASIRKQFMEIKPKIKVDMYANFQLNQEAQITVVLDSKSVTRTGEPVLIAQKAPITEANIKKQLCKLGDTMFEVDNLVITLEEGAFYPLKSINGLRRQLITELENQMIRENGLCVHRKDMAIEPIDYNDKGYDNTLAHHSNTGLIVSVRTQDQLSGIKEFINNNKNIESIIQSIYLDSDMFVSNRINNLKQILADIDDTISVYIALPYILRKRDQLFLQEILDILTLDNVDGCLTRSLEGYAYLKEHAYNKKIVLDANMYIWNKETKDFWDARVDNYCIPFELNSKEQRDVFNKSYDGLELPEKIVYGRIPMMVTANCIAKTTNSCLKKSAVKQVFLKDRMKKEFPVVLNCTHCMNIIYNTVPLSLHGEYVKWKDKYKPRLDFTIEDKKMTKDVLDFFVDLQASGAVSINLPFREYTTGHEKRIVN